MAIDKVYFTKNAIQNMKGIIEDFGHSTEVGGCIVGCQRGNELLVTHASKPGKKAKMARCSIVIDNIYTTKFSNRLNELSDKKLYFIGDWHTHLSDDLRPSNTDYKALKSLDNYVPREYKKTIVSVIVNHFDSSQLKVYKLSASTGEMQEIEYKVIKNPDWLAPYIK